MPVPARFHALRDRALAAVDQTFAEPVRLSFMKGGSLDPDREQVVIEAVLRTSDGKSATVDGGQAQAWRSRQVAQKAELHISRTFYVGPMPAKGDAVRAISRPGEPAFEVLNVDDRGHTRLVLELGEK
ncbi:hypothetical protein FJ872_19435 [Mesorhizobium sp. B2-5-9]|uniref:hypothetical protein n=1 Tax=Mesorhizobium sp. B2-5-9 TaxID=2589921 RepID=UPI00112A402B|nr:hypothetical protein [Mesorhizobium sp. B2-5-9]TPK15173.1 hypothetical protein FJ872_19435 [Mesorhizobium sp. B2-5-9]